MSPNFLLPVLPFAALVPGLWPEAVTTGPTVGLVTVGTARQQTEPGPSPATPLILRDLWLWY